MAIPIYWTNYKWSDKATTLSKIFSFITMFGGAFGIIFLVVGVIDLIEGNIEAILIGLLLTGSIVLLNIYAAKILQTIAKKDIESKIAKDTKFASMYFLEYPPTLPYILKLNPSFEPVYRDILNKQWYCSKCSTWNSVDLNTCDCGTIKYNINK